MDNERENQEGIAAPAPPRGRGRRLAFRVLLACVLAGMVLGTGYFAMWTLLPASREERAILIQIPRNSGAQEIARRLHDLGLIRNATTFLAAGYVLGELGNLKAGEYELNTKMSPVEILDKLARGDVTAYWITVPEGATVADIARTLEKQKLVRAERFVTLARRAGLRLGARYHVPNRNLEGYLFPDTYRIEREVSEERLIGQMLAEFERQVLRGLAAEIAHRGNGLSVEESIILASLVEREARVPSERARIAGVLANRLRKGMRLECDATIQYALGETKPRLTYDDLKIDSPYNTYRHAGLPPTPICSPGRDSIRAALQPEKHDYLFYVADGKTGGHLFSRTFAEHKAAIRKVRGG